MKKFTIFAALVLLSGAALHSMQFSNSSGGGSGSGNFNTPATSNLDMSTYMLKASSVSLASSVKVQDLNISNLGTAQPGDALTIGGSSGPIIAATPLQNVAQTTSSQTYTGSNIFTQPILLTGTGNAVIQSTSGVNPLTLNVGVSSTVITNSSMTISCPGGVAVTSMTITNSSTTFNSNGTLILGSTVTYNGFSNTGGGTALLGTNSPAITNSNPYTWFQLKAGDGSTVYIPVWK